MPIPSRSPQDCAIRREHRFFVQIDRRSWLQRLLHRPLHRHCHRKLSLRTDVILQRHINPRFSSRLERRRCHGTSGYARLRTGFFAWECRILQNSRRGRQLFFACHSGLKDKRSTIRWRQKRPKATTPQLRGCIITLVERLAPSSIAPTFIAVCRDLATRWCSIFWRSESLQDSATSLTTNSTNASETSSLWVAVTRKSESVCFWSQTRRHWIASSS